MSVNETPADDINALAVKFLTEMEQLMENGGDEQMALIERAAQIRAIADACRETATFQENPNVFKQIKQMHEEKFKDKRRLVAAFGWMIELLLFSSSDEVWDKNLRLVMPLVASYLPPEQE